MVLILIRLSLVPNLLTSYYTVHSAYLYVSSMLEEKVGKGEVGVVTCRVTCAMWPLWWAVEMQRVIKFSPWFHKGASFAVLGVWNGR